MSRVQSIDLAAQLAEAEQQSSALTSRERELRKQLTALQTTWWNGQHNKPSEAIDQATGMKLEQAIAAILAGQDPNIVGLESLEAQITAVRRKLEIIARPSMAAAQRLSELRARLQAATDAWVIAQVKPHIAEALRRLDDLTEFLRAKIFEPLSIRSGDFDLRSLFADDLPSEQRYALWKTLESLLAVQDLLMFSGPRAVELRRRRGLNDNGSRKETAA